MVYNVLTPFTMYVFMFYNTDPASVFCVIILIVVFVILETKPAAVEKSRHGHVECIH